MGTEQRKNEVSITHLHGTTPPQNDLQPRTEPVLSALALRPERVTDQRERLGGALEEIRAMGDKLDEMREVAAERASTIRELNAHVDYLEGRIIRLEDDLKLYMRKAVSLARTIQIIWQAAEEGNRLAKAADEGEAGPEA